MNVRGRLAKICRQSSLTLAVLLPFLVFFDAKRNIDLQGILLLVAGGLAWCSLLLQGNAWQRLRRQPYYQLIAVFVLGCFGGVLVNPHLSYDLIGAPYVRLGALSFMACIGCGWLVQDLTARQISRYLYLISSSLALLAIPYSLLKFHSLLRIGGLFAQADIFAVIIGGGFLIGLALFAEYPKYKKLLWCNQAYLAVLLLLTQTRAVIGLTIILSLAWQYRQERRFLKRAALYLLAGCAVIFSFHALFPGRLTNPGYATESIHYRLALQSQALRASGRKPVLGYGPGNLADALDCSKLSGAALQKTCHEGYFFNSSHNIYIDRVLAIGWIGGLAYAAIIVLGIFRGLRGERPKRILAMVTLLIALYYFTNVTSVVVELLVWVLIFQIMAKKRLPEG